MAESDRLSSYPYVVVRIGCSLCGRSGQYRLARLAAKFGPEIGMGELLERLALDCPRRREPGRRPPGKYDPRSGARFVDLERPPRPPDLPPPMRKLTAIPGGKG